jgi:pyridoxine 4-dehydrogenase
MRGWLATVPRWLQTRYITIFSIASQRQKDELIIPIPGAKNARQASENIGAIGWRLSEEEMKQIENAAE